MTESLINPHRLSTGHIIRRSSALAITLGLTGLLVWPLLVAALAVVGRAAVMVWANGAPARARRQYYATLDEAYEWVYRDDYEV